MALLEVNRILALEEHSAAGYRQRLKDDCYEVAVHLDRIATFLTASNMAISERKSAHVEFRQIEGEFAKLHQIFRQDRTIKSDALLYECDAFVNAFRGLESNYDQILKGNLASYNKMIDRYNELARLFAPLVHRAGITSPRLRLIPYPVIRWTH